MTDGWLDTLRLTDWQPWLAWIGVGSLVLLVGSLVALPVVVARIPEDYFTPEHRSRRVRDEPTAMRLIVHVAKNVLGVVFVLAGIAMLILPGQGVLTILIGVMLMDFPRKYELERWLITRGPVLKALNWIRAKAKRPPLRLSGGGTGAKAERQETER